MAAVFIQHTLCKQQVYQLISAAPDHKVVPLPLLPVRFPYTHHDAAQPVADLFSSADFKPRQINTRIQLF